jgi:hypothetical protein
LDVIALCRHSFHATRSCQVHEKTHSDFVVGGEDHKPGDADVCGLVDEEENGARDVVGAERLADAHGFGGRDGPAVMKAGADEAGLDAGDFDAGAGELHAQRFRECFDGVLGAGVGAGGRADLGAEDAGDVDEVASVLPGEVADEGVGDAVGGLDVGTDHLADAVDIDVGNGTGFEDPGIVDAEVAAAEALKRSG